MSTPYTSHASSYVASAPQYYRSTTPLAPGSVVALGGVGAMIGAVGASAVGLRQVRNQQMTNQEAMLMVAKEAAGMGLATAAAGAVVRTMGLGGFAGLLGVFTVAAGVKYFWNQTLDNRGVSEKEEPKAPQKPKKKAKK